MKKSALLLFFLLSLPFIYSQPKYIININTAYCLPLQELQGDMKDSSDRVNTYEMKSGYSIGIEGKYFLGRNRNLGVTISLGYTMFSNSEAYVNAYGNDVKRSLSAVNFGVGAEYDFIPAGKVNPFINAQLIGHMFNGNFQTTIEGYTLKYELEPATRYGAAIGLGINFELNNSLGLTAGSKYNFANLLGKEYDTTTIEPNKQRLQDNEHVVVYGTKYESIAAKNISYLQLYLGVTFYFGQPKSTVKK